MNKKYLYSIVVSSMVLLLVGGTAAGLSVNNYVDSTFIDPWDKTIFFKYVSMGQLKEANEYRETVNKRNTEFNAEREVYDKLSPEEKVAYGKAGVQAMLKSADEEAKKNVRPEFPSRIISNGIYEYGSITEFDKRFYIINGWKKDAVTVSAGYHLYNPLQGEIMVFDQEKGRSEFYLVPMATGPVKIISENKGIITLLTVGGTYEVQDNNRDADHYEKLIIGGGEVYRFDLKNKVFLK
jgi:hypothetical protein